MFLKSMIALVILLLNIELLLSAEPLIKIFEITTAKAHHPSGQVCVGAGYKLICGGARANWHTNGSLLTHSYPSSSTCWSAQAKDHDYPEQVTLTIFAVGIHDPNNQYNIRIDQHTSAKAVSHPATSVNLPAGYTALCGGARDNWSGQGNLLTASYPEPGKWIAKGKDHKHVSPATITAFIISAKLTNGCLFVDRFELSNTIKESAEAVAHPKLTVAGKPKAQGWFTYGGGAEVEWKGMGNMLTAAYPSSNLDSYICRGKDHEFSDPSKIKCIAFSIRQRGIFAQYSRYYLGSTITNVVTSSNNALLLLCSILLFSGIIYYYYYYYYNKNQNK